MKPQFDLETWLKQLPEVSGGTTDDLSSQAASNIDETAPDLLELPRNVVAAHQASVWDGILSRWRYLAITCRLSVERRRQSCSRNFARVFTKFRHMRRLQRLQLVFFMVIVLFLVIQVRQSVSIAWYGPGIVKWLGESAITASHTTTVQRGSGEADLGANGRDLKRQKGGTPERSYIMFDRSSDLGPPTRVSELDLHLDDNSCRNTAQGPDIVADDRGRVCMVSEIGTNGAASGCCPLESTSGYEPLSCTECDPTSNCCASFESCVACCLRPERRPDLLQFVQLGTHPAYFSAKTPFDVCLFRCRSSSASTIHENTYRSRYHHCYGINAPLLRDSNGNDETGDSALLPDPYLRKLWLLNHQDNPDSSPKPVK